MAEDQNAFVKYGAQAREKHITFVPSFMPGFTAFDCDVDVYVGFIGASMPVDKKIPAGTYYVNAEDDLQTAPLYRAVPDMEALRDAADKSLDYDEAVLDDGQIIKAIRDFDGVRAFTIEPFEVAKKRCVTFVEYVMWLALGDAESDEIRDEIINAAYPRERKADREEDDLLQQDTAKPRKREDPKTKLSRAIGIPERNKLLYRELGVPLKVASESERKRGKSVDQIVAIQYMGAEGILAEGREELTQLDRQVHNAIISHYVAGNRVISLIQVCEAVYGHSKPTDDQKRDVEECLDRQMWTKITIDMTAEAANHTLQHPELLTDMRLEGQMLAIQKGTAHAVNGKTIIAYHLMGEPLLYTHAKVTGQLLTYPVKLLQAPGRMKNTERTMAIRQRLLEEIDWAKKGRSRFIKYDTLYEGCNQTPNNRMERSRQNNYVREYLEMLKEYGEIEGWKERKEGKKQIGFEVYFAEKKKSPGKAKKPNRQAKK